MKFSVTRFSECNLAAASALYMAEAFGKWNDVSFRADIDQLRAVATKMRFEAALVLRAPYARSPF